MGRLVPPLPEAELDRTHGRCLLKGWPVSSTQNGSGERDCGMKQTKRGNDWYFAMKADIGVDAASGFGHTVVGTAANVSRDNCSHGGEHAAFGNAGYPGMHTRSEAAGRRATCRGPAFIEPDAIAEHVEKTQASIRRQGREPVSACSSASAA